MNASAAKLAVVFGGPSPEHDVSILTGLQATHVLAASGRDVFGLYWTKTGAWYRVPPTQEPADFVEGVPRGAEPLRLVAGGDERGLVTSGRMGRARPVAVDVVVNACHGVPGEDGTLQGAFDLAGLTYTGPGVASAAIGMDKLAFAGLVAAAGLPSLPRVRLQRATAEVAFDGPYVVKPRFGGSSIGVEVVKDLETAVARLSANVHLAAGAVLEPYRPDLYDLNVAVRAWPEPLLSAVERPLRTTGSGEILGYSDKYVGREGMASAPRELPAAMTAGVAGALRAAALELVGLVDVRGVARLDFLSDGEELFVNEVNTIPGSLGRHLWVDPPVAFIDLLDALVDEALACPTARHGAAGADGTVLRGAGGIAGKLA